MWSKHFWKETLERAIKTAAQTAVALIGTELVGIIDLDWTNIASVSAVAALLSVLTSVGSDPLGKSGTPSLVRE